MGKHFKYSKEFKIFAVRILKSEEKKLSQLAMKLRIKRTLLYLWKDQPEAKGDAIFNVKEDLRITS